MAMSPPCWPDAAAESSYRHGRSLSTVCFGMAFAVAIAGIVLADAYGGDHALAVADIDDAHAAGGASRYANSVDRTADQRSTVGHQHDLVAVQHRERRHDLAAPGQAHQFDALAAASGHPILVSRSALAEARRGDGEHELLLALQLLETLGRQRGADPSLLGRRRRLVPAV